MAHAAGSDAGCVCVNYLCVWKRRVQRVGGRPAATNGRRRGSELESRAGVNPSRQDMSTLTSRPSHRSAVATAISPSPRRHVHRRPRRPRRPRPAPQQLPSPTALRSDARSSASTRGDVTTTEAPTSTSAAARDDAASAPCPASPPRLPLAWLSRLQPGRPPLAASAIRLGPRSSASPNAPPLAHVAALHLSPPACDRTTTRDRPRPRQHELARHVGPRRTGARQRPRPTPQARPRLDDPRPPRPGPARRNLQAHQAGRPAHPLRAVDALAAPLSLPFPAAGKCLDDRPPVALRRRAPAVPHLSIPRAVPGLLRATGWPRRRARARTRARTPALAHGKRPARQEEAQPVGLQSETCKRHRYAWRKHHLVWRCARQKHVGAPQHPHQIRQALYVRAKGRPQIAEIVGTSLQTQLPC